MSEETTFYLLPYEKWKYSQWAEKFAKRHYVKIDSEAFHDLTKEMTWYTLLGTIQNAIKIENNWINVDYLDHTYIFYKDEYTTVNIVMMLEALKI